METFKDAKLKDVDIGEHSVPTTIPPPEPAPTVKNEVCKLIHSKRRVPKVRTSIIIDRAAIVRARLRAKLLRKKEKKTTSDGSKPSTSRNFVVDKPSSRYHFRQKYSEIPKLIVQKYDMYKQLKDLKSYLVQVHTVKTPNRKVKFQAVKMEEKVRLQLEFDNWMGNKHGMPKIEPISEDESELEKPLYTSEIKIKKEESNTEKAEKIKQEDQIKPNEALDHKEIPFDMQQQQNNNDTYHFSSQLPTIKEETMEVMDTQEPIFEEVVEDGVVVEENGHNYSQHLAHTERSAIYVPNFRLVPLAETPFATQNAHNRVYATLEEFFADRIRLYSPLIEICMATMGQEEFDAFLWHAFVPPASLLPANTVPTVHLYWNPPNDNVNAHFFGCEHGYNHIHNAEIPDDEIENNEDVGVVSTDDNEDNIDIENFDDDEGNVDIGDSDDDKENMDMENSDDDKENIDMENSDDDKENVDIESSDDDKENSDIENSDAEIENARNEYIVNENEVVVDENVASENVEIENIRNEDMENEYVENEHFHFENSGIDRPQVNFNRCNGRNNELYRINIRSHEVQPPSRRYYNNIFDSYAPPEWINGIGYPEHVLTSYHPFGLEERIYIGSQIINEEFNAYIRYVSRNN